MYLVIGHIVKLVDHPTEDQIELAENNVIGLFALNGVNQKDVLYYDSYDKTWKELPMICQK